MRRSQDARDFACRPSHGSRFCLPFHRLSGWPETQRLTEGLDSAGNRDGTTSAVCCRELRCPPQKSFRFSSGIGLLVDSPGGGGIIDERPVIRLFESLFANHFFAGRVPWV